jgi:hypothetical protein
MSEARPFGNERLGMSFFWIGRGDNSFRCNENT